MYVLIPALIRSVESERLLLKTLEHIPAVAEAIAVVISQGQHIAIAKPSNLKDLLWQHYKFPLTKWGAISRALEVVPYTDTQVILLDADDPVEPGSFEQAISQCLSAPVHCWIGRRDEIALYAEDELSEDSRFFLEMFTNTILLNRAAPPTTVLDDPPDIQSGFYAMPASTLKRMEFDYVEDYGGELALCYQIWQAGITTANLNYSAQPRKASAYRLQQIFEQIMRLPFFLGVTKRELEVAMKLAPMRYRRYFNDRRLTKYNHEMVHILEILRSI